MFSDEYLRLFISMGKRNGKTRGQYHSHDLKLIHGSRRDHHSSSSLLRMLRTRKEQSVVSFSSFTNDCPMFLSKTKKDCERRSTNDEQCRLSHTYGPFLTSQVFRHEPNAKHQIYQEVDCVNQIGVSELGCRWQVFQCSEKETRVRGCETLRTC
jgi:hypothetical protein